VSPKAQCLHFGKVVANKEIIRSAEKICQQHDYEIDSRGSKQQVREQQNSTQDFSDVHGYAPSGLMSKLLLLIKY
jgi:hypothetical protein